MAALLMAGLAVSGCGKKDEGGKGKDKQPGETKKEPKAEPQKPPEAPAEPAEPRAELPADTGKLELKLDWAHGFGSLLRDEGKGIAIDAAGNVVATGLFSGDIDFGGGTPLKANGVDAFVASFAADGTHRWSIAFGGSGEDLGKSVAIDSEGNAIVTGWFSKEMSVGAVPLKSSGADDAFVVKLDPDGIVLWARKFGAENIDLAQAVAVMPDNSVVITGEFRTTVDFGGGPLKSAGDADIFLMKLAADGSFVWAKSFGYAGQDYGRAVAVDSRGDILLAAEFTGTVDFGGKKPLEHVGNRDAVLVKLDGDGKHIWAKGFGGSFNDLAVDVAVDAADNVFVVGAFEDVIKIVGHELKSKGETDAYVAKFGPDGKYQWTKQFGAENKDVASGVGVDKFGNVFVTGWFTDSVDFGGGTLVSPNRNQDAFLVALDPDGKHLWSRNYGAQDHDRGFDIAVHPDGYVGLTGRYRFDMKMSDEVVLKSVRKAGDKIPQPDIFVARFER